MAINAPINTPIPSRKTTVNTKIQVGDFSNSGLSSKMSNLKTLDIVVAMIKKTNILFQLILLCLISFFIYYCERRAIRNSAYFSYINNNQTQKNKKKESGLGKPIYKKGNWLLGNRR
jgi:cbb3-type cytochrome oxidase subunit 3